MLSSPVTAARVAVVEERLLKRFRFEFIGSFSGLEKTHISQIYMSEIISNVP